ncbi:DNA ligase D [Alkalihalophilus sp. As8PL]|uniref:DNA ligase (ATP) n=1 Tax=Alkalihalophilus sp. As8PL TaxID=3237103 RepID=A0AB39BT29_9BACI
MMKPMLLSSTTTIPSGENWLFEVKYDGYRCLLVWEKEVPRLISRSGKDLTRNFPEVLAYCKSIYEDIVDYLPLIVDGELVHLINDVQSDFSVVQRRGKLRSIENIHIYSRRLPIHYVVFDLLQIKEKSLTEQPLYKRKDALEKLFKDLSLPIGVNREEPPLIQCLQISSHGHKLWEEIVSFNGEGMIAKKKKSIYTSSRSKEWLKLKNWRFIDVIITSYDKKNGYFHGSVYKEKDLVEVTIFRHGLSQEEAQTLSTLFQKNGEKVGKEIWVLSPSICVRVSCIGFDGKQLREPAFHSFLIDVEPQSCTWRSLHRALNPLPQKIELTHEDKPIWPSIQFVKDDYILYLQRVSPYLLPFLINRLLTVIRYPHGAGGESFFQKNCPEYAPSFIETALKDDIDYITCNDMTSLLWLGNQLALEFHIPFQPIDTTNPTEIVFDLDPPSVEHFHLARTAALQIKEIFDRFSLISYVKTSGNKGLQLYIPLPPNQFSYKETRIFSEFISHFLCEQSPDLFTVERLKKNRNGRLYVDYIQHDEGKTIIAPYSPRGHEKGLVATPLYWEEVTESLDPDQFTLPNVVERLRDQGDPFRTFNENLIKQGKSFRSVLDQLMTLQKEP